MAFKRRAAYFVLMEDVMRVGSKLAFAVRIQSPPRSGLNLYVRARLLELRQIAERVAQRLPTPEKSDADKQPIIGLRALRTPRR
jgi:hypothetical protein